MLQKVKRWDPSWLTLHVRVVALRDPSKLATTEPLGGSMKSTAPKQPERSYDIYTTSYNYALIIMNLCHIIMIIQLANRYSYASFNSRSIEIY